MQKGCTEQNERRTLQREFDIRSLEEGKRTPQHLFDSLRKNSFEAKCACISPLTPSSEGGIPQCIEWGMREDREWMGELETEYLSVRRRRRPRPLRDEPTAVIHSEAVFRLRN